jgi:molybdopterin molybdotransferase
MISVGDALEVLKQLNKSTDKVQESLKNANGLVLAQDVLAPIDQPNFNQSAMDGYALHFSEEKRAYKKVGEIQAGSSKEPVLKPGECVRIFTGAKVPASANTVIQQEWATEKNGTVEFDRVLSLNKNIRYQGEQIKTNELALPKGHQLNPASIGFLANLGVTEVMVYRQPIVHILTTGNELVPPGEMLKSGQIYESNSQMLYAALQKMGITNIAIQTIPDDYQATVNHIREAIQNADLVLISGGISVGDYDFVKEALAENNVKELFYKVNQKPGKPLYIGQTDSTIVAALPGNPAAALTCFYIYVQPMINALAGKGFVGLQESKAQIDRDIQIKGNRAQFLKAYAENEVVSPLDGQSSAMLKSYALANALIYIPENRTAIQKGDSVVIYQINQS